MTNVIELMNAAKAGDRVAASKLLPVVYGELRKLAAIRMASEAHSHTLQPTALVHEAYIRLIGPTDDFRWDNAGHFFAAAADAMRRILVDAARRKAALRHGGDRDRVELLPDLAAASEIKEDLVALDEALARLGELSQANSVSGGNSSSKMGGHRVGRIGHSASIQYKCFACMIRE